MTKKKDGDSEEEALAEHEPESVPQEDNEGSETHKDMEPATRKIASRRGSGYDQNPWNPGPGKARM